MRVLITGGSGFIGRHLVAALQNAGHDPLVVDRRPFPDPAVPIVLGDLRDPTVRDRAVSEDLDAIVHLAAVTSVLRSVEAPEETYETNLAVTAGLLELARRRGVPTVSQASTNAVVGPAVRLPFDEEAPLHPLTPYGATKAAAEMLASAYSAAYGLAVSSLRLTNVFGPGMEDKDSFVPRLLRAARDGHGVEVYGDGSMRRDYVEVSDVVRAFLLALETRLSGALVIGSGVSVSVLELVEAARRASHRDIPVVHGPARPGEMPAVVVDIGRARRHGWEPRVDLDQGMARAWETFRPPGSD